MTWWWPPRRVTNAGNASPGLSPDVDPLLRRQVDAVVRSAAQTPDPRARVNQWRQTS